MRMVKTVGNSLQSRWKLMIGLTNERVTKIMTLPRRFISNVRSDLRVRFHFLKPSTCINCREPEFQHDFQSGTCLWGGEGEDATGYEPVGWWRMIASWFRRIPTFDDIPVSFDI